MRKTNDVTIIILSCDEFHRKCAGIVTGMRSRVPSFVSFRTSAVIRWQVRKKKRLACAHANGSGGNKNENSGAIPAGRGEKGKRDGTTKAQTRELSLRGLQQVLDLDA
jgi:hypothetical protein